MKTLLYRVVEIQAWVKPERLHLEAYLLIQGHGVPIRFDVSSPRFIEEGLRQAVAEAYRRVTGAVLPDTAH
jgi:hypothetical protein